MKSRLMTAPLCAGLALALFSGSALAQTVFTRGTIGMSKISEQNVPVDDGSGAYVSSDVDEDLWFGSFAAQVPWHKGVLEFGYEAGAGLGWTSPDVAYVVQGDGGITARVAVKTDLLLLQTAMGLYGALNFGERVRLSVSAGPAFLFGSQSSTPTAQTIMVNGQPVTVTVGGKDKDATLSAYAHADVHVRVAKDVWIGVGASHTTGELDFSNTIGELPLDDTVFSLSFGAPMDI